MKLTSAPFDNRYFTTLLFGLLSAAIKIVIPFVVQKLTSAPDFINLSIILIFVLLATVLNKRVFKYVEDVSFCNILSRDFVSISSGTKVTKLDVLGFAFFKIEIIFVFFVKNCAFCPISLHKNGSAP